MNTIPVVFSRNHKLGSLALRTAMWSPWSHCGLVLDGVVVEATASHGVRRLSLSEMLVSTSHREVAYLPCADPLIAFAAAESQVGKKYDWGMVLGHTVRQDWDNMDRWACSELVAWAIQQGGTDLFRRKPYRITPQHLYLPRFLINSPAEILSASSKIN